ncbi:TonB-dependent receptor [Winogradskyella echinorum]|uniref:TonB-dependent receptor n=1 Tax=Winogradskyella echinorum TaxID=538189 RepID=A0ABR6Y1J7_9FLAO|nr:TonB-dependent receptor [Winogradskyella echinorum]MBC3846611.1 TonB-dependent receptor [Winogradskyella echinorum]MBC5750959.1 TonB-dependent receptor [Winogradskyella echinorum]
MQLKMLAQFLVFFSFSLVIAQKEIKVEGTVVEDGTNIPLEYATITFKSKPDNKIVTGGITDSEGKFSVEVPTGTYTISVEYISYKTKTYTDKTISKDINLGTVSLAVDMESLGEVTIIAERTTVEIKLDKKIYNVGKDLTVRGGTVSDVLDNVPSVSVDVEGNVALRGNDDVRILINGKPSGLVGLNSTEALRQLPADAIERVEVITSPSARYDAEGTAGILNIILRRSKLEGMNGAITVNAGHPTQAGISGNINYRTGDVNFFNTTSYNYREIPGNSYTNTEYLTSNNSLIENRDFDRIRKGLTTNFGVEWYINDSASLTTSIQYRDSDNEQETTNILREFDTNNTLLNTTTRFDPEFEEDKTIQYSVNFDKQFNGDSNHKFTANFQYEDSSELEQSLINQDNVDVEDVTTDETQERIFLQADYVKPIGEVSQLELGYQGRFTTLDTDYAVAFNDGTGNFDLDEDLSNNLVYKEYVNAFYTQFGSKIKEKFSYLLGLRMEESRITVDQVTSGDFNKKNYLGFFPTINLAYELNEDENLTLGYNRRIRRPRSRFINPFPSRSSATNLFQGNPDIDPSYSNTIDLGYYNKFGKLSLNTSLYVTNSTDVFVFITEDTGETAIVGGTEVPVIRRTPINLASNDRYGFEFTLTYRPTRKWNMNGNFNLFRSKTEGFYEGTDFGAENTSWFIRFNNKYTLPGNVDWQTRMDYRGPSEDAQNKNKGIFSMNLAFSKDLFNDKASVALNVSDVFNSRKRITETTTPTFNSESEFQWRQRTFNLSFTYRFNQQPKRERSGDRGGDGNGGGDDFDFEG